MHATRPDCAGRLVYCIIAMLGPLMTCLRNESSLAAQSLICDLLTNPAQHANRSQLPLPRFMGVCTYSLSVALYVCTMVVWGRIVLTQ